MTTTHDDELRKGVVAVLKRYPGITSRMDLSIDSPLVIELANESKARELAARKEQIEKWVKAVEKEYDWSEVDNYIFALGYHVRNEYIHMIQSQQQENEG